MIKELALFLGLLCGCSCMSLRAESSKRMTVTSPDGNKKMYVEHASKSDLEGSASGYIYQSDGKSPATLVQLGEASEPHDFSQFVHEGYHSFLEPYDLTGAHSFGGGHDFGAASFEGHDFGGYYFGGGGGGGGGAGGHSGGGGSGEHEEGGKYFKQNGHHSEEEFHHSDGDKGGKGYKDYDEYNKGLLKKLHDSQEQGYKKHAGGNEKKHFEEDEKYHDEKKEKKGEEGENFSAKKNHKKGHKTTGFHNIYHKDEYKKDHSFFDEADDGGHHAEYGSNHEAHGAKGGDFSKHGHHDSDYHSGEFLKKGDFHHGDHESGEKGHHGSEGGKKYHSDNEDYGRKGSKHFHKESGHRAHHGGHSKQY